MPSFYRPGKQEPKRAKAEYGASITFKIDEVKRTDIDAVAKHEEMFWVIRKKAIDIGYSLTTVQTGQIKENYTAKCYAQWADMKDGGYSLSVTHCKSPGEAEMALCALLHVFKYRLDTVPESDVEF